MNRMTPLAAVLLTALVAIPGAFAQIDRSGRGDGDGRGGMFDLRCLFSHSLPDDPIVYPGQPGASHMHDFFGFRRTNANTRQDGMVDQLRQDRTVSTCGEGNDMQKRNASAYWTPSLYVNGTKVDPRSVHVYYQNFGNSDAEAFPAGFRVIAGNPAAPPEHQKGKVWWWCGGYNDKVFDRIPADCDDHDMITASIHFPTCWNGQLDSSDHRSHVVYQQDYKNGRCPEGWGRKLPRITMHLHYNIKDAIGRRVMPGSDSMTLASGPITSLHADYMFAWEPDRLRFLLSRCLNARRDCRANPPRGNEPEGEIQDQKAKDGAKPTLTVLGTSEAPRGGATFSAEFAVTKGDERLKLDRASCFATLNRRMARLEKKDVQGNVATCTWRLPSGPGGALSTTLTARVGKDYLRKKFETQVAAGESEDPRPGPADKPGAQKEAKPRVDVLRMSPETPRAGETFSAEFAVLKGEERLELERASCFARVNNRMAKLESKKVEGSTATCTWRVPEESSGATLRVSLSARVKGAYARKTFEAKVA